MTTVLTSSTIIIIIVIIFQLTCAVWQLEKPGLKRGYEGMKKHNTSVMSFIPASFYSQSHYYVYY
jgi:hypothetical protein